MKVICITQARYGSSRLPGKVLLPMGGLTMLDVHLRRAMKSRKCQEFIVATTGEPESAAIAEIALRNGWMVFQGSMTDVLDRFYQAVKTLKPDLVIRITSDCPLVDAEIMDRAVNYLQLHNLDYVSNTMQPTWPDGFDVEVFRFSALEQAWKEATSSSDREHVTPFIWRNSDVKGGKIFYSGHLLNDRDYSGLRLTVDHQNDYDVMCNIVSECGTEAGWEAYMDCLLNHAEWQALNQSHTRNETYKKGFI